MSEIPPHVTSVRLLQYFEGAAIYSALFFTTYCKHLVAERQQRIVLRASVLLGPGQGRHLLPVCWSQVHSPGIQLPNGLRGNAGDGQGQGSLYSKKKKDRNMQFVAGITRIACFPRREAMKRNKESSHLEVWLNEGGERVAVNGGWEGEVIFDLDFWR